MDLTINLDIHADREPELFAGIVAIPEVCRLDVIRSLLELAIRTPAHAVAMHSAAFDATVQPASGSVINKRLSFRSQRTEDAVLHGYFAKVNAGRRKQTVRSLLMLGLIIERSGIRTSKASSAPVPEALQSTQTQPLVLAQVVPPAPQRGPVETPDPAQAQAPAPVVTAIPAPTPAMPPLPAESLPAADDLEALFGACHTNG